MPETPGRNDPCPCGSGKKYKKCCLLKSEDYNPAGEARKDLVEEIGDRVFESLEEAQAFVKSSMDRRNSTPVDEFHGISPIQMHRILEFPFTSPEVLRFNFNAVKSPDDAPMLRLFSLIAGAIGEKGLKPTATGNLPREASREIARNYLTEERHRLVFKYGKISGENDVPELKSVRMIATLAGLFRNYGGRIMLTKECSKLVADGAWAEIYEKLFKIIAQKFNWAYEGGYFEMPFFMHSFAFTMYLLYKYGETIRTPDFYADCFINAFPMLLDEIPDNEFLSVEERIRNAYSSQAIETFGELTGICSYRGRYPDYTVQALPLLRRMVYFNV